MIEISNNENKEKSLFECGYYCELIPGDLVNVTVNDNQKGRMGICVLDPENPTTEKFKAITVFEEEFFKPNELVEIIVKSSSKAKNLIYKNEEKSRLRSVHYFSIV